MNELDQAKRKNVAAVPFENMIKDAASLENQLDTILTSLPADKLQEVLSRVMEQKAIARLDKIITIAGIDLENEKEKFLMQYKSKRTRLNYSKALDRLQIFAASQDKNILELNHANADDFILNLQNDKNGIYSGTAARSNESIRLDVAAVSSFFTFMERRHETIKNPFRGTKARPKKQPAKGHAAKYENIEAWGDDIKTILSLLPADLAAAVACMSYRGLRIGALPDLFINGNRFNTSTKGKEQNGEIPAAVLECIGNSGLNKKRPFDYLNKEYETRLQERKAKGKDKEPTTPEQCLKMQLNRRLDKMYKSGSIKRKFSPHDFRHFYAVTEYNKDKDIYRVSKLLNHSSIQITEIYLKGLNVID